MRATFVAFALSAIAAGCGASPPVAREPADESAVQAPDTYGVALRLEDGGMDEHETPHTRVALVRIAPDGAREVIELSREMGACYHEREPGALIAVRCWWAGAGARYLVRREGEAVVAYRAEVDEETGEAEPREVGRVEVPAGARLEAPGP